MKQNTFINSLKILSLTLALSLGAASLSLANTWCESGKVVKFAAPTWDSAALYTAIARAVIEKGYGCKTDLVVGSKNITETALVTGDLEVWMEQWAGQNVITAKAAAEGKVKLVGDLLEGGTVEGWFVPDYVIKGDAKRGIKALAPSLRSVSDLKLFKSVFADLEEPSKGRFLNCPTGWECEKTNSQKLKAYQLTADFTNFHPGTGGALDAEISSAYQRGKPILFYYWSPSSILGKYNFIKLAEPPYDAACWSTLFNNTTDNVCGSSSPSSKLLVAVSAAFDKDAADIVTFLSKLQLKPEVINKTIAAIGDKKLTAEQAATNYIKNNMAIVSSWVPESVFAKLK